MATISWSKGELNEQNIAKLISMDARRVYTFMVNDSKLVCLQDQEKLYESSVARFITAEQAKEIAEKVIEKLIGKQPRRDLKNQFENPFEVIDLIEELGL